MLMSNPSEKQYINLIDSNGMTHNIEMIDPTIHDDGFVYFEGLDKDGNMQSYRIKYDKA